MQEKYGNRLVLGPDCMVDASKYPNQTFGISESHISFVLTEHKTFPLGKFWMFLLNPWLRPVQLLRVDSNLVFGNLKASPTKCTPEPFWPLVLVWSPLSYVIHFSPNGMDLFHLVLPDRISIHYVFSVNWCGVHTLRFFFESIYVQTD